MSAERNKEKTLGISEGIRDGIPVFVGYISASIAFGLTASIMGFSLWQSLLFSALVYTGSGQFLALKLIRIGATPVEIALGVFMLNLRYMFMTASLDRKLPSDMGKARKSLLSFWIADESFSIAALRKGPLTQKYLFSLVLTCYGGWLLGTTVGTLAGSILSPELQMSAAVTLYAMFASLLSTEARTNWLILAVAGISAVLNTILTIFTPLAAGWTFIISMVVATIAGAIFMPDKEKKSDMVGGEAECP
ncbi:AzlC family ABC transporter permease [Parasphaerochaeta coccoides]|uniref:AzlC family protein n=1 Tax=Parasphaerochaeta coccoides (strain ATCC BAA-1237 / DSM 17374 / SPN1) TaxID=760011 RepID=F4GH98_PARC1|nr:AzlC family ABC transporter permease [Parasphaerochaeta coccoides]AEC01997.1 AzlC family protein [Parasphaerochaeta coccoides DSM 17374]